MKCPYRTSPVFCLKTRAASHGYIKQINIKITFLPPSFKLIKKDSEASNFPLQKQPSHPLPLPDKERERGRKPSGGFDGGFSLIILPVSGFASDINFFSARSIWSERESRRRSPARSRLGEGFAGPTSGEVPALRRIRETPAKRREVAVLLVLRSRRRRRREASGSLAQRG